MLPVWVSTGKPAPIAEGRVCGGYGCGSLKICLRVTCAHHYIQLLDFLFKSFGWVSFRFHLAKSCNWGETLRFLCENPVPRIFRLKQPIAPQVLDRNPHLWASHWSSQPMDADKVIFIIISWRIQCTWYLHLLHQVTFSLIQWGTKLFQCFFVYHWMLNNSMKPGTIELKFLM